MKIISYKYLGNSRYKIKFEEEEHILYEDIILKYSILGKENIDKKDLEKCLKENLYFECYYKGINYINKRLRTKLELKKYLNKEYDSKLVNNVLDSLEKDGYLNEDVYTSSYIHDQINLKMVGPLKIKKDLEDLGISNDIINKHIESYTKEDQNLKIKKIIEKEVKLNKNKSSIMLKNKILKSLIEKGFYNEDILEILECYSFDDKDIYKKEYEKLYNKLSKKYSGKQLEYKIKEKMYQKGFRA